MVAIGVCPGPTARVRWRPAARGRGWWRPDGDGDGDGNGEDDGDGDSDSDGHGDDHDAYIALARGNGPASSNCIAHADLESLAPAWNVLPSIRCRHTYVAAAGTSKRRRRQQR